jgi:Fe-S-cluster containining protein
MKEEPFYAQGLKFSCKRCSACCRYESGFVYLCEKDMEKLSLETNMDANSFIKTYCRWVKDLNGDEVLSLKEKSNNDCIFWEEGCMVYNARPVQCVTFPFWENILSSKYNWQIASSGCPGIDNGDFHSARSINECINMRVKQPIIKKEKRIST